MLKILSVLVVGRFWLLILGLRPGNGERKSFPAGPVSVYTFSYAESPPVVGLPMLLTDPNGPMSLQPRRPGFGRVSRPARFAAPAILFLSAATFGAAVSYAQDQPAQNVAEAARQERARKQELQKRAKHVYTEEDLKHSNILTPEDRAQIEAKRSECAQQNNCAAPPTQNPPASLDAASQSNVTSLGEVARQLRKQKELQALKPKQAEPFHLPFSTPALASPILPERPAIHPPAQPVLHPKTSSPKTSSPKTPSVKTISPGMPSGVFRRDPFSAVAVRPEVRRPEIPRREIRPSIRENVRPDFGTDVHPTLRAHTRLTAPAAPKISSHPVAPSILIQPRQPLAPASPARATAAAPSIGPAEPKQGFSAAIATQAFVKVLPGDSLWKLAQQNLGGGNRWRELLAVNPGIADPNQIRAGAQLILPAASSPEATRSRGTGAGTVVTVRKGDTLWSLAKSSLGRSSAWPCLAAANPSLADPNRIYQGQLLVVSFACRATAAQAPARSNR